MNELQFIDNFLDRLKIHARTKAELFDGIQARRSLDETVRFAIEELGEVSSAITRHRLELAKAECLDVAHCALLIAFALERDN